MDCSPFDEGEGGGDEDDNDDTREVLFLREKAVEVVRDGYTSEVKYLMSIRAAKKLLAAVDKVIISMARIV